MSSWYAYDDGRSIGKVSSEGGVILLDDEHPAGARITLKRGSGYISISCNLYGKMDHTRFFGSIPEAQREFRVMRAALSDVLGAIEASNSSRLKVWDALSEFVRRFP